MKEYKILFEDQENGLEVPVILEVCGENFFDAIGRFHNEVAEADFGTAGKYIRFRGEKLDGNRNKNSSSK